MISLYLDVMKKTSFVSGYFCFILVNSGHCLFYFKRYSPCLGLALKSWQNLVNCNLNNHLILRDFAMLVNVGHLLCYVEALNSPWWFSALGKKGGVSPGKATSWFKVEKRHFWPIGLKNTFRAKQLWMYSTVLILTCNPVSLSRRRMSWICISCLFIGAPWSFLLASSTTGSLNIARGTDCFGRGMRVLRFVVLVTSVIAVTKYLAKTT